MRRGTWFAVAALLSLSALGAGGLGGCARPPQRSRPAASAADVSVRAYEDARRAGAVGSVVGKVYQERRTADASDLPLTGTVVTLLPKSDAVLSRLEALKQQARDSMQRYRDAATDIRRAREDYEQALWESGGADLIATTTVNGDGTFRLDEIPEGRWLVYASRSVFVSKPGAVQRQSEQQIFLPRPHFLGYYTVNLWLRQVEVTAQASKPVELTDRNVWFTGVAEDWDTSSAPRTRPGRQRRK